VFVGRQASEWRDATRSTICGMAVAAAAVVTTGRVCVSGGADDCAAVCEDTAAGQGRARSGQSVLSCPRENEREGVRMHEARRFATPMRLLDVSLSTRIDRNRGSLAAGRYHIIIGTRP
jgi:hypothetical protein